MLMIGAGFRRDHSWADGAAHQEGAGHVDVHHRVKKLLAHLEERLALDEIARVVDEDVDGAEPCRHRIDDGTNIGRPGQVSLEHLGFTPLASECATTDSAPSRLF